MAVAISSNRAKSSSDRIVERLIFVITPVLFLLVWELLGDAGILNAVILPTPVKIVKAFWSLLLSGKFAKDFSASVVRVLLGFLYGTLAGLVLGILTGLFSKVSKALSVLFGILRPIPTIGLVPLMILWFGIGETSKVIVIAIGTFWSVLLNTQAGIEAADSKLIEVARILEKDRATVLFRVIMPAALPSLFTGIRLGIGNAWKSVVAAEMLAATKGIGHMIEYARELAQPAKMFVGILTVGIVGLFLDVGIRRLQKRLLCW